MREINKESRLTEILMHAYNADDLSRSEFSAIACSIQWLANNPQATLQGEYGQDNFEDILKLCEVTQ